MIVNHCGHGHSHCGDGIAFSFSPAGEFGWHLTSPRGMRAHVESDPEPISPVRVLMRDGVLLDPPEEVTP
jgi:hypothetical protein